MVRDADRRMGRAKLNPSAATRSGNDGFRFALPVLQEMQVGLNALNIPHGKGGTEAAIEYLGESVGA